MHCGHVVYRYIAIAPPAWAILTVTVARVNVDEIAEDSPCARVYRPYTGREGGYSRVVDFFICVTRRRNRLETCLNKQRNNKEGHGHEQQRCISIISMLAREKTLPDTSKSTRTYHTYVLYWH